jgi:tetratricopeptide (TPR) repeat protein
MGKYEKLKFTYSKLEGAFDWGENRYELFERFYEADEILDKEVAESEFKMITKEDPEFIDAYNSLGWLEMDSFNYGSALYYFEKAYKIGNSLIPKTFNGEIIWGIIDNRPFLKTMQGLGLSFLLINEYEKALKYFKKNLEYNSNDNQGIRALAIHCYMALGDFKNILKICSSFPDDTMSETIYGKVYALYNLEKLEEAEIVLKEALHYLPLVAKELISNKHKPPINKITSGIVVGSKEEAFEYWERFGQFWTSPRLKSFLNNVIEKSV